MGVDNLLRSVKLSILRSVRKKNPLWFSVSVCMRNISKI